MLNKKRLYEQIMSSISKEVKRTLNEQSYNLSIDDNDFDDDLDVRHEDNKGFNDLLFSVTMKKYIEEHGNFNKLNKEDYIYIESLYDKYGSQYKVRDRKELDQIVKNYKKMNKHLNWLDVSNMTDMSYLINFPYFDLDISKWDVSNVTNMEGMFYNALNFNQPIRDWDVSNVTNMKYMFDNTHKFNQPIGKWDVSNVTNMSHMFYNAHNFNQSIGGWDVSNVTNMKYMFDCAAAFNLPIGDWNVSNVIDMAGIFYKAPSFNQDLSSWNICCEPADMFKDCPMLNKRKKWPKKRKKV